MTTMYNKHKKVPEFNLLVKNIALYIKKYLQIKYQSNKKKSVR